MRAAVALGIVIVCGVAYHLAQKGAGGASPWPMLAVAYGVAFAVTVALAVASGDARRPIGRAEGVAGVVVGLSALGIEAGYFFVYRSGWPLASASVIANVVGTAILALAGVACFGDHPTPVRLGGLALALAGAALVARGQGGGG